MHSAPQRLESAEGMETQSAALATSARPKTQEVNHTALPTLLSQNTVNAPTCLKNAEAMEQITANVAATAFVSMPPTNLRGPIVPLPDKRE